MPMLDMPLSKMRVYQGSSPKPADFDAFWDKGLAELYASDLQVTMTPAAFKSDVAQCFDVYFTGLGGARVYFKLLVPRKVSKPCKALLLFHGYSGDGGDWSSKLGYVGEGFVVAALDCRGQGGKSEDSVSVKGNTLQGHIIRGLDEEDPAKLYFRNVFLDTAAMAKIVMDLPYVDETKVAAMGGSQGGALTLACIGLVPSINRAAPYISFLCDYKRIWEMDMDERAYVEMKQYFRHFDPRHEREDEIFERLGYIDVVNLMPRVKASVLMGTGLMDNVCPPSTQFAAFNHIQSPKQHRIYPDFGHEELPGFKDEAFAFFRAM